MKNKTFLLLLLMLIICRDADAQQTSTKKDLVKLTWIEGNWKGMDGNNPFYEIYKLANDSTLEITSYEWDGIDSSKTSITRLQYKNDHYYLGDSLNWKVVDISGNSIFIEPVYKAYNTILWKKRDQHTWEAILESKKGRKIYVMEWVNHFANKK